MAALYEIGYDGPVCIEVEDGTFGKTLEGRKRALKGRAECAGAILLNSEGGKTGRRQGMPL